MPRSVKSDALSNYVSDLNEAYSRYKAIDNNSQIPLNSLANQDGYGDVNSRLVLASQLSQTTEIVANPQENWTILVNDLLRENSALETGDVLLREIEIEQMEGITLLKYKIEILEYASSTQRSQANVSGIESKINDHIITDR